MKKRGELHGTTQTQIFNIWFWSQLSHRPPAAHGRCGAPALGSGVVYITLPPRTESCKDPRLNLDSTYYW